MRNSDNENDDNEATDCENIKKSKHQQVDVFKIPTSRNTDIIKCKKSATATSTVERLQKYKGHLSEDSWKCCA